MMYRLLVATTERTSQPQIFQESFFFAVFLSPLLCSLLCAFRMRSYFFFFDCVMCVVSVARLLCGTVDVDWVSVCVCIQSRGHGNYMHETFMDNNNTIERAQTIYDGRQCTNMFENQFHHKSFGFTRSRSLALTRSPSYSGTLAHTHTHIISSIWRTQIV